MNWFGRSWLGFMLRATRWQRRRPCEILELGKMYIPSDFTLDGCSFE